MDYFFFLIPVLEDVLVRVAEVLVLVGVMDRDLIPVVEPDLLVVLLVLTEGLRVDVLLLSCPFRI